MTYSPTKNVWNHWNYIYNGKFVDEYYNSIYFLVQSKVNENLIKVKFLIHSTGFGRERHACGLIKWLSNDHKILFYTGGRKYTSYGSDYTYSTSYDAYFYDLQESNWHSFEGVHGAMDMEFVKTSPYEGFIFNFSPSESLMNWYIWDEYKYKFYQSKTERLSLRRENTVAAIPKTSPLLENCQWN